MEKLTLVIGNKNYSSWSLRPWLALKQAGLDFEEIRIALYRPDSAAKIREYSPSGKVPALIHGSLTVWDSLAIFSYLAETFPDLQWLPKEKTARAIAHCIMAEMHSGFQPLRENMPMNCRARLPGQGMTPEVQQNIDRITSIWDTCRQQFGQDGDFLFGPFTLADAMYAPVVLRFITYGVSLNPVGVAYTQAILALPALQEWLQSAEVEVEKIESFERYIKSV